MTSIYTIVKRRRTNLAWFQETEKTMIFGTWVSETLLEVSSNRAKIRPRSYSGGFYDVMKKRARRTLARGTHHDADTDSNVSHYPPFLFHDLPDKDALKPLSSLCLLRMEGRVTVHSEWLGTCATLAAAWDAQRRCLAQQGSARSAIEQDVCPLPRAPTMSQFPHHWQIGTSISCPCVVLFHWVRCILAWAGA